MKRAEQKRSRCGSLGGEGTKGMRVCRARRAVGEDKWRAELPFECQNASAASGAQRSLLQTVAVGIVAPGSGKTNRF